MERLNMTKVLLIQSNQDRGAFTEKGRQTLAMGNLPVEQTPSLFSAGNFSAMPASQTFVVNKFPATQVNQALITQQKPAPAAQEEKEEEKKKTGLTFKRFTNILAVVLAIGAIGGALFSKWNRPSDIKQAEKLGKILNKDTSKLSDAQNTLIDLANENENIHKNLPFRMGIWFDKLQSRSKELFNNVIYGLGTVFVMPLVILFSPFGKKDSTKDDKIFAILRQPLSFITLFSMQLTVDKYLGKLTPRLIKENYFEKPEVKAKLKEIAENNGELPDELLSSIKYNEAPLNKDLEKQIGDIIKYEDLEHDINRYKNSSDPSHVRTLKELEAIKKSNAKDIAGYFTTLREEIFQDKKFNIGKPEYLAKAKESLKKILYTQKSKIQFDHLSPEALNKLIRRIHSIHIASKKADALKNAVNIATNVVVSSFIGCTTLNVIYGKFMKNVVKLRPKNTDTPESERKGGLK